jgi:type IV pilus assembly protein PilV
MKANLIPGQRTQHGFSIIEVLVAIVIIAIGLLGLAGLQTKLVGVELEAYQRSNAILLLEDMMNRIRADEPGALDNGYATSEINCSTPTTLASQNICAWLDALAGTSDGEDVGGLLNAQGCLEDVTPSTDDALTLRVSIAWQGLTPTAAPPAALDCGEGDYGEETLRRVISGLVVVVEEEAE